MSSQNHDETPRSNSAQPSAKVSFADRAAANKQTTSEKLNEIADQLRDLPSSRTQQSQVDGLVDQIDQLSEQLKTMAQSSDVVDAMKSASEIGLAKGFAAGQDDLRQEVDALGIKTDNLNMHFTPMQRQLQAQSVDLSVLSKDLNNNTQTQCEAIKAQNALT